MSLGVTLSDPTLKTRPSPTPGYSRPRHAVLLARLLLDVATSPGASLEQRRDLHSRSGQEAQERLPYPFYEEAKDPEPETGGPRPRTCWQGFPPALKPTSDRARVASRIRQEPGDTRSRIQRTVSG